jgi:hypothetical protein
MLTVESGPFLPTLQQAFLRRIETLKKDPLVRVAVVAPSGRLLEQLQRVLGAAGHSYLNIHFHTFTSLAENVVEAGEALKKPILSDPLFFDTLVKFIIRDDKPFRGFTDLAIPQRLDGCRRSG